MADREKVIKALEYCIKSDDCLGCMHWQKVENGEKCPVREDALVLLKEQEAKPMAEDKNGWHCPSCDLQLIGKTASGYPCDLFDLPNDDVVKFCPRCGQAVKWDENENVDRN